ncbi:MAG: TlpA family protein disulfide reductase [Actinobacteria bacterium]|nr:MAG: TlpA family protein disulfide reductase [Actinomycetota bacterium]
MPRLVKLGAQALAVAAVAGLFALLVWRVVHQNRNTVAVQVAHGKTGPAPAFNLPRLDGHGRVSLASLRGKAVIVNFWASWCAPCKREAPQLERSWKAHSGQGLVVLGIDANDVSGDARHFARRLGLTYPLVHAPTTIWDDWGVTGVPETFFVDRRGRLVDVHVAGPVLDGGNKAQFERGIRLALRS